MRCEASANECPAKLKEMLKHFSSRLAFNLEGLGEKIIELLIASRLVSEPADFFKLTKSALEVLPGFGEKSAKNLLDEIEKKRTVDLHKFIYALGIREVGDYWRALRVGFWVGRGFGARGISGRTAGDTDRRDNRSDLRPTKRCR